MRSPRDFGTIPSRRILGGASGRLGVSPLLSQTVEYALRAAVFLANEAPEPRTTEEIAATTKVPKAYLSKVLQALSRAGLVRSQRGIGGGMSLAREASQLTLLQVVNAVEPIQRILTCPLGIGSHGTDLCPLHRRLDNALAAMESSFGTTTLADVLSEPSGSVPLCDDSRPQPPRSGI